MQVCKLESLSAILAEPKRLAGIRMTARYAETFRLGSRSFPKPIDADCDDQTDSL